MSNIAISAKQARDNFSEILGRVKYGEEIITIEKKGKPYAVIISPEQYEAFQRASKKKLFEAVEQIQSRNNQVSSEIALSDATTAVDEIRKKTYDKKK